MTARRALHWAAAALLACTSLVSAARAEPRKVRFLVEQPTAFSSRLRAEIEAMGFEIVPSQAAGGADGAVVAEVRVAEAPALRRVEVWIGNGGNGRLDLGAVVQPSPDDDEDLQSVRASEQLRALFQPLRESRPPAAAIPPPPAASSAEPPPPSTVPETPPRSPGRKRRFEGVVSVAAPLPPGTPGIDGLIQGRWLVTPSMGVGGALFLPFTGSTLHSGANEANVSAYIVDAELSFRLSASDAPRVTGVAGIGVAWVRTKGDAAAPYTNQSDAAVVTLPLVGIEIAPALGDHLRLCWGARAGFALPGADIEFAGEKVALWGRPLVLMSVGVSVDL